MSSRRVAQHRLAIRRDHALGNVRDAQTVVDGLMAKLQSGINGRRGLLVVVDGGKVFAMRPDAIAATAAGRREVVGLYLGDATRAQIADDLHEWLRLEAKGRAA